MSLDLSRTELELAMRKLANTVKLDTIEACAKIAAGHNGISPKDGRDIATKIRLLAAAHPPADRGAPDA